MGGEINKGDRVRKLVDFVLIVISATLLLQILHAHAHFSSTRVGGTPTSTSYQSAGKLNPDGYPLHCGDTSYCDREPCHDQRDYAPPASQSGCVKHTDVMGCFRSCLDPGGLRTCYNERRDNNTQHYCLLRYNRTILQGPGENDVTTHLGLSCLLKCKVDPKFWNCVHLCDKRGCFSGFRKCEREGRPPPCTNTTNKYWVGGACKDCYISNLVKEVPKSSDCFIRYTTASTGLEDCVYHWSKNDTSRTGPLDKDTVVAKDIETCIADISSQTNLTRADDVGVIEACFRKRLMRRQMDSCSKGEFTQECQGAVQGISSRSCHERCFRILSKPYCHIPCKRNVLLKEECEDDCKISWPHVKCICSANNSGNGSLTEDLLNEKNLRYAEFINRTRTAYCRSMGCILENVYVPKNNSGSGSGNASSDEIDLDTLKLQNCKSNYHVTEFAKGFNISNLAHIGYNLDELLISFDSDLGQFSDHYTFYECHGIECVHIPLSSEERIPCVAECVKKRRSSSEMDKVCVNDPSLTYEGQPIGHFFRSQILLGCMLQQGAVNGPGTPTHWTFQSYIMTIPDVYYYKLLQCEKDTRDRTAQISVGGLPNAGILKLAAHIAYQLDAIWCRRCASPTTVDETYHFDDMNHAKCALQCYERKHQDACPRTKSTETVIEGIVSTKCSWKIDYSLTRRPFKIWKNYFDEIPPFEVSNTLQRPNTEKYLRKTKIGSTEGHYVFPYFVVLRPTCDKGYYDDEVYKFITSGSAPFVQLVYLPDTSRVKNQKLVRVTLQAALINLERISPEDEYLEANKLELRNATTQNVDGKHGCHLNLCYPAFVLPQVILHMPIVKISVLSQGTFVGLDTWVYAAALHSRESSGLGKMKLNDDRDTPSALEYFPNEKTTVYEDTQYVDLWNRLPESGYVQNSSAPDASPGPELNQQTDVNCKKYKPQAQLTIGGNENLPLDLEDFMRAQYTHGNTPQVVMAGFYDPNLVIVGDPDFINLQLTRWNFEVASGTKAEPTARVFHGRYSCLSQKYKVGRFKKPIYSYVDRSDPDYWLQFYRMRYAPKNYENASEARAIFDTISLEDRIVLVTTGGLVSLYQNLNTTASQGKAWEVEGADNLERCFKIVRTTRRTQQDSDTIIAITYDYQVMDTKDNVIQDVNQEIWIGKYTEQGKPIIWREITTVPSSENIKEERMFNIGGDTLGTAETLPSQKTMVMPVGRRELNPKSQVEAICYQAYRSNMGKAQTVELIEDDGWCNAIDATPINAADSVIQVLVRMRTHYNGSGAVYFYIVASYDISHVGTKHSTWQIKSIIPRVPCENEHREAIRGVKAYATNYFRSNQTTAGLGCYTEEQKHGTEPAFYLHGLTYTKSYTQHLFIYGNSLLQSTDSGQTFIHLRSFPMLTDPKYLCRGSGAAYHSIKLMTFDSKGHYAFLTNKRELWYGSLGSFDQIRLRPADSHTMISTRLYAVRELQDAVPFAVFFDSNDELVELVAVVDNEGTAFEIARRSINEKTILRATYFLDKFAETGQNLQLQLKKELKTSPVISSALTAPFKYNHIDWSIFCPYASASVYHNFSELHARVLTFSFPTPRQHLLLGHSHIIGSLHIYQGSSFGIMWNAFLNAPETLYSHIDTDLFGAWVQEKIDTAVIGRMNYLSNDPTKHGILVLPSKYQRYKEIAGDSGRIFAAYYMDYGVTMHLLLEYSVSNDFTFNPVNYIHHRLEVIDINVENSNGSLIQIDTEREVISAKAAVRYVVHVKVKQNTGLHQRLAGRDGIRVPVTFHLVRGFGKCIASDMTGIQGDSISTEIVVGCPTSQELVLDWASTVKSIKFRETEAHYGLRPKDCYNEELFCFYVKYPLVFHFDKFDSTKLVHHDYSGKYVMRITGGGYSRDTIQDFTEEEQQAFNIPGVSDVSLIWNEWDREFHRKVDQKDVTKHTGRNDSREVVLTSGVSSIQWACHTLSPCARILPRKTLESIFYFKVFISNRGVDNDTLCLFEKEFVILIYGFPPSTEIQLTTTMIFYIVILMLVYIAYVCAQNDRKVWRWVTERLQDWAQVLIDALPKNWTKTEEEEEEETEVEKQKRRDEIILSLQGHLNVPRLVHKAVIRPDGATRSERKGDDDASSHSSVFSISTSSDSSLSGDSEFRGLNPVINRPEAQTWTDIIYEQIISRRLAAIIERNKQEAEELKKTLAHKRPHK